jgi:putative membrane protein
MISWWFTETFSFVAIGKRLGLLLVLVAAYSIAAGLAARWLEIRVLDWGSAASVINTVILSLLLSFRNRVAYDRWWEARGLWGQLTNDSRNLASKLAAWLPAEVLARSRVAELLTGFAEALKRHLRGETFHLRDLEGLEQEEADPGHVPLYLAGRLYAVVADWKRAGLVDGAVLWILDAHLRGLLDVCGACERIRNTPLSPSYKSLLRAGLILNVLAAPWLTVPELGFWSVSILELVCFFLLGVELIDSVVEEPFGREHEDLDLDRYSRTIRDGVRASLLLASTAGQPATPSFEAHNRVFHEQDSGVGTDGVGSVGNPRPA